MPRVFNFLQYLSDENSWLAFAYWNSSITTIDFYFYSLEILPCYTPITIHTLHAACIPSRQQCALTSNVVVIFLFKLDGYTVPNACTGLLRDHGHVI